MMVCVCVLESVCERDSESLWVSVCVRTRVYVGGSSLFQVANLWLLSHRNVALRFTARLEPHARFVHMPQFLEREVRGCGSGSSGET